MKFLQPFIKPLVEEARLFNDMLKQPTKSREEYVSEIEQKIRDLERRKISVPPTERAEITLEVLKLTRKRKLYT